MEVCAPSGAADRAVARNLASYMDIFRVQPPSVILMAFAFEALGALHEDAMEGFLICKGGLTWLCLHMTITVGFLWYVPSVSSLIRPSLGRFPLICPVGSVSPCGEYTARSASVCGCNKFPQKNLPLRRRTIG